MPVYSNILVAIDASPGGHRALEHAGELATALGARITIVSVTPPVPAFAYRAGIDIVALEQEAVKETEGTLRDGAASLSAGVPTTTKVRSGHPAEEIVAEAQEGGHDLLVIGSRGRGRLVSALLGSVAAAVHFHLSIPMLVVQLDDHPDEAPAAGPGAAR